MQILIIQTAFLGDVILTTPMIEAIKNVHAESSIDFLTIPPSLNIVETNPHIRQVIVFDKKGKDRGYTGLKKMAQKLSDMQYDICLTPHRSWRSAYLSGKTNARIRVGFDISGGTGFFTHLQTYKQNIHEIERNLSLLEMINIEADLKPPRIYPLELDKKIVEDKLKQLDLSDERRFFALAPGSVWPTKRWPSEYYVDLIKQIEKLGYKIVLIGGPDDIFLCEYIKNQCQSIISWAGELTLRQTYYFLTNCSGLVTNDSAPLHLGVAAQIPIYAIFGATTSAFGFAPFGPDAKIFENKNLACRPCGIHGGSKCPTKTFDCMLTIKPEFIKKQIIQHEKLHFK